MHPPPESSDGAAGDAAGGAAGIAERLRAPRLVGRAAPLQELDTVLERSRPGAFRVALIAGPAGVGKTRLAAEAAARHADRVQRLSGRSYRWGATTSFGLWAEALDQYLRRRPAAEIRDLCGTSAPDLAALLKAVEAVEPGAGRAIRRGRLLDGLVELFDRLSLRGPVLIVLDDVHLADNSSWEALGYLSRRLSRCPITVFATARPGDLSAHPVAGEVLQGLDDDGALHRLELHPLPHTDVTRLAREVLASEPGAASSEVVPETLVSWLIERSRGRPLFIVGLLRALVAEGADVAAPRLTKVPETLRERVNVDLRGLAPEDRRLLEMLAVVDRRIDPRDLARISRWMPDRLAASLERLTASQLVAEHGFGPTLCYEVAHPVIQDTIYQGIGGARRRMLHRLVARALLDSGLLGSAAAHFARSAERDDAEAIDALCRAMRQAEERGLYQEALAILDALLNVLPNGDERWLHVLDAMAWQAEWVVSHLAEGHADTAIAAMRRMESVLQGSGGVVGRATVQFHLASFLSFGAGRLDEAERACRSAIGLFDSAGQHEGAMLARNELAWIHGCAGDVVAQAALAGEVLEAATHRGHRRAAVQAAGSRGYALGLSGHLRDAMALLQRSIDLAGEEGYTYRVAWGRAQLNFVRGLAGHPAAAAATVEEALSHDPAAADAMGYEILAHCDWLTGRLDWGVGRVQQSMARRPLHGSRRRAWALALAARMYAEMGQHGRARSALNQARATYGDLDILVWSSWCPWTAGFLAWHDGDNATASAALDRAANYLRRIGAVAYEALVLVDVAEVAADAGEWERADAAAGRLGDIAAEIRGGLHPYLAALAASWGHLGAGRYARAAAAAEDAGTGLAAGGYRLYHGSALEVRGRALRAGDRGAAVEILREAWRAYDACAATWRRERVLRRLGRLGSRGRRAVAAVRGPEALTDRERDVARLAARGYTAGEVGRRLFIGKRTVESHLASVYTKLGVTAKRDLIRHADELGL